MDVDVQCASVAMRESTDDQPRLAAAYSLALATDAEAASVALATALADAESDEVLRRAAKFGAAAACRQQLLQAARQSAAEPPMVRLLLDIISAAADALTMACAARALLEHGVWGAAGPELRLRVVEVLAEAATNGANRTAPKPARRDVEDHGVRPPTAGQQRGIVHKWLESKSCGFISPCDGGDMLWAGTDTFGGGALVEGGAVWFDVVAEPRFGKQQAIRVGGPAVWRGGGRPVGIRNARAAALEALATVPVAASDPSAAVAAQALARMLRHLGARADTELVGNPSRLGDGEALMAAAFGSLRLVSQCAIGSGESAQAAVLSASWWPELRDALSTAARAGASARPPSGARKAGSGGTPGADQGLRYTLAHCLDALLRAGDLAVFEDAVAALPAEAQGPLTVKDLATRLVLRRCHLTTSEHSF